MSVGIAVGLARRDSTQRIGFDFSLRTARGGMGAITRQQLCAELGISESTVRRLEQAGLPFTPVGKRMKRYDLEECKMWLRDVYEPRQAELSEAGKRLMETARKSKRRVEPS